MSGGARGKNVIGRRIRVDGWMDGWIGAEGTVCNGGCEGHREERPEGLTRKEPIADRAVIPVVVAPFLRITRTNSSWLLYYTITETRSTLFRHVRVTRTGTVHKSRRDWCMRLFAYARAASRERERKRGRREKE